MTSDAGPQRATRTDHRPELVVWTSLWAGSLPYVLGEAEQLHRFAFALRKAMDARDLSARRLAKELGVDARRVTGWRNGKTLPNLYESQALAAALGVDEDLFRNPPEVPPPPPEPYYPLDQYLLDAVRRGTERAREAAAEEEATDPEGDGEPPGRQERPSA